MGLPRLRPLRPVLVAAVLIAAFAGGLQALAPAPEAPAQRAVPARPADAFVESIGVNVHLGYTDTKYYTEFPAVAERLDALGVRYVRSEIADPAGWKKPLMLDLYDRTGIRMLAVVSERAEGYPSALDLRPAAMDSVLDVAEAHYVNGERQAIVAFEGPNEYDNSHGPDDDWARSLRVYQQMLYDGVSARAALRALPVLAPSFVQGSSPAAVGDLSGSADASNVHSYPGGRAPETGLTYNLDAFGGVAATNAPVVATETGYHNATGNAADGDGYVSQPGVPEQVEAKYLPRLYMEYFRRGIERTFSYEFVDLFPDPDRDHQEHNFGLVRNDLSEKPVFRSLQSTIALLADPGAPFTPGALSYELAGETDGVRQVLLQKRDGRFFLVLWQSVSSYEIPGGWRSGEAGTPLRPEPAAVTLDLAVPAGEALVYRPLTGSTAPVRRRAQVRSLSLEVPDHLVIIELRPRRG